MVLWTGSKSKFCIGADKIIYLLVLELNQVNFENIIVNTKESLKLNVIEIINNSITKKK